MAGGALVVSGDSGSIEEKGKRVVFAAVLVSRI